MNPSDIVTTDGVIAQMTYAKWEAIKSRMAALEAALRRADRRLIEHGDTSTHPVRVEVYRLGCACTEEEGG